MRPLLRLTDFILVLFCPINSPSPFLPQAPARSQLPLRRRVRGLFGGGEAAFLCGVAILSELIGSGRASDKLLKMYFPFLGLALLAVGRGLISSSGKIADSGKRVVFARKKRA
ncbi:hypothetical protein AKJ16_DCAP10079 [Drosera capensis]